MSDPIHMTPQVARRILTDAAFYDTLLAQTIDQLARQTLDGDVTLEQLIERRGIRKGLMMARSYFEQARGIVRLSQEEADEAQAALSQDLVPPGFVSAMIRPVEPSNAGS